MPTATSKGMAGLLQDAGVTKAAAPVKGAAPAATAPALPQTKGMAGLLSDAKVAPSGSGVATPAVKTPLFGDVSKALTTQIDQTHQGIGGFFSSIGGAFKDAANQLDSNVDEWGKGGFLHKVDALGKTMLLPVNVLFSPITAALQSVQGVPVVAQLADGLNRVFGAIGAGGADAASLGVDQLPISQEHKDAIRPLVQQLGALAAQIVAGKAGGYVGGKVLGKVDDATGGYGAAMIDTVKNSPVGQAAGVVKDTLNKEVVPSSLTALKKTPTVVPPEIRTQVVDKTKELGKAVIAAVTDPKSHEAMGARHTAMNAPITPAKDLFTKTNAIPEAKASMEKPSEMHPTLRGEIRDATQTHGVAATHAALQEELGATHGQAEGLIRQAPVPQTPEEEVQAHQQALSRVQSAKPAPTEEVAPETAPEPKVETPAPKTEEPKPLETEPGQSRVGKSIEAKAIESKITKGFENTAGYDVKTFKAAAEKTAELINSGIDNARAVVRGDAPRPEGVTTGSLLAGVEEYAKANPKEAPEILSELANSKLASETSAHAQETGSLRMREQDSATQHLQNLKKSLIEAAGGADKVAKAKATLVKGARAAIKAAKLSKEDASWDKFLDTITC